MINQQMVKNPWGISVYAAASVKAAPDLVRIRFRVARSERDATEAFSLVNEDVRAVREVLRRHGVADSAVDRSQLKLETDWNWEGNKRRFVGYECSAAFTVETRRLEDVQQLLIELISAGGKQIEAVDFDVVAKPQLRAEARVKAVEAARVKAELYASGPDSTEQDLAPGHVVVTGAVMLGFAIEHG
jgi:uncharacterized protein YggE